MLLQGHLSEPRQHPGLTLSEEEHCQTTCTCYLLHFPLPSGPPSGETSVCPVKNDPEGHHPLQQLESLPVAPVLSLSPHPGTLPPSQSQSFFFPVSVLVLEIWPPPFYACGISGFGNEDRATHPGFRNSFTFLSLHSLPAQLFSGSTTSHCQPVLRTRDICRSKPESLRGF